MLIEEPDVASFLRLQLTLFQYPNGIGIVYSQPNSAHMQANARDRTLEFIQNGVHLSPLRLITQALMADSEIGDKDTFETFIKFKEIYALANDPSVNRAALPERNKVVASLGNIRTGIVNPPDSFERRFNLLQHTDLFELGNGGIKFRVPADDSDKLDLIRKIETILSINSQFDGFDNVATGDEIVEVVKRDDWGVYFDAFNALDAEVVSVLSEDIVTTESRTPTTSPQTPISIPMSQYDFRTRDPDADPPASVSRQRELADPEATRIKRQRRTLDHKILVDAVDQMLRGIDAVPKDNPHIDLYAEIPNDGSFIFEMKSGGENLLDQIRKGISQLYEYRYRYNDSIRQETTLCLVLKDNPTELEWVKDYVCIDREICLCWLGEDNKLEYPDIISEKMSVLIPN